MNVLRKAFCALKFRKNKFKKVCRFRFQDGKKGSHYFNSRVFKCKMLDSFPISYMEGPGNATMIL